MYNTIFDFKIHKYYFTFPKHLGENFFQNKFDRIILIAVK